MLLGVRVTDMDCIVASNKSYGSLFLGNIRAAEDGQLLQRNNIRAVLSVIDTSVIQIDRTVNRKWIAAEDSETFNLLDYFDDAVRYIDDQLKVTNVLVHCYAGISRSTTIVAAYLMKKREISSKQALNLISQYRSQIGPNPGFLKQLRQYETQLQPSRESPQTGLAGAAYLTSSKFPATNFRSTGSTTATPRKISSIQEQRYSFSPVKTEPPKPASTRSYLQISKVLNFDKAPALSSLQVSNKTFVKRESMPDLNFDTFSSPRKSKIDQMREHISKLGQGEKYRPETTTGVMLSHHKFQRSLFRF